ncbi:MAG TPA: hypothetical protein VF189_00275, partial [Patescibacteria group bacterium]
SSLGAVQSKVLDLNKKKYIQAVGIKYIPHTFWVKSIGCGLAKNKITVSEEVGIGAVGSVVRKSVLDSIGGFDEKIVHNLDDIDLGWRIWIAGYRVISVPKSITYHWTAKPASTRNKVTPGVASEFYFQKTFRIFLKNYEWKNIFHYSPWLFMILSIRVLSNLLKGNTAPLKGYIKAFIWNIQTLQDSLIERKRVQSLRRRSDFEIFKKITLAGNFPHLYFHEILPLMNISNKIFKQ